MRRKYRLKCNAVEKFAWVYLTLLSITAIVPMVLMVIASVSTEESLIKYGFKFIPDEFSSEAYKILIYQYGKSILRAILITLSSGILQPIMCIILEMCAAYPLSQDDFRHRQFWNKFLILPIFISGGIVINYIVYTQILGLRDNILVYFIPTVNCTNIIFIRTFFRNIDRGLVESAKIDGASKLRILWSIMIPLTKPLVVIFFFNGFISRWNDITTCVYYITSRKLYTIQYLLQEMLRSAESTRILIKAGMSTGIGTVQDVPIYTMRYSLAVVGVLPVLILFPYFQKFYAKGVMMGSIKG